MLFGRGHWAVFGIDTDSLDAFKAGLSDRNKMFLISQLSASVTTKFENRNTTGINPFENPRLDEGAVSKDTVLLAELAAILKVEEPLLSEAQLNKVETLFGYGIDAFKLHQDVPMFGFWLVHNEYKDVEDVASKKEALAYTNISRPFKFTNKDDKKGIEATVAGGSTVVRKQFPVIVDLDAGRVYAATTNQDSVYVLRSVLRTLGAEVFSIRWEFDGADWYERFINQVQKQTKFQAEFNTRADELTRFRADEIEKLADKQMEKNVSNYFALAQLDTELWCGLTTDAKVRLHKGGDPCTVGIPGEVTNLLKFVDTANVAACQGVFQELLTKTRKGVESTYWKDSFTIELSDKNQMLDVGAVLLRGFEVCGFKRAIIKSLRKTKSELTISHYWFEYARQMRNAVFEFIENVSSTLELDVTKSGIVQAAEGSVEAVEEA